MNAESGLTKNLQKQSSNTLLALLDDMFASCDDLYFDLASRANSNVEQNLYFESMREVRVRAQQTRNEYELGLKQLFNDINKAPSKSAPDSQNSELNLVGDDEVEQDVALSAMHSRARAATKGIYYELNCRMSEAYGIEAVDEHNNPLDPASLCTLFANAAAIIEIDIKARIILFKQYERYVINRLPEIYNKANSLLKDAGIPFNKPKRDPRSQSEAARSGEPGSDESVSDSWLAPNDSAVYQYSTPSLSDLTSLLTNLRFSQGGIDSSLPWFASGTGAQIPRDELIQLLETPLPLQQQNTLNLRNYVQQLLARGQPEGEARSVQQLDEDVINLVAMFFDFVFDDESISPSIKALVSRLQMPILKVALRDKSFFSNADHPARELVNEIARQGIGIDDDKNASELLEKIDDIVHRVQETSTDQEECFTNAVKDLIQFGQQLEKRATLVEKRTSEAEMGKAKTEVARTRAQHAIHEAMDGKELPAELSAFIAQHWQEALFTTQLREGEESPAWLDQLQTMQDLIWCSQPQSDEKSKRRLTRIRAGLYEKISSGLQHTTLSEEEIKSQVEQINLLHESLAAGDTGDITLEKYSAEEDSQLDVNNSKKAWKEMTALERQKVQYQALTYEYIEKAEAIAVGSWLEFKEKNTGTLVRCKLATKLEASDKYIFVNRLGFKVIEKARKEFAFDLQRKRARPLKSGPLFDRSLHSVVSRLKKMA